MAEKKKIIKTREVPGEKIKAVEELIKLINKSRAVIIVSIKNLPSSQFQLIKKKIKEHAIIKVMKKNIVGRVIDSIQKGAIKNLKKYSKEDTALIFSELDPFELSGILARNKTMARAKIGQTVEEDIIVEPGPTELVPGPIISELGALGLKFAIEDGKVSIKEKKVILKAGNKVNEAQASIMAKLDMKPIAVGLEPLIAYDSKEDRIYEEIKIDQDKTIEDMKQATGKSLALAVKIAYACKETIGFLLRKASSEEKVLSGLIKEENKPREEK